VSIIGWLPQTFAHDDTAVFSVSTSRQSVLECRMNLFDLSRKLAFLVCKYASLPRLSMFLITVYLSVIVVMKSGAESTYCLSANDDNSEIAPNAI
jgi:hypothetical protein